MIPTWIDFETFWAKDHSLDKLGPLEYVTHPETELISCAVKFGTRPTRVLFGPEIEHLKRVDWSNVWLIGHNMAGFDALILAWRLGIRPKMWGCTLSMARPIHAITTGLSLGALVKHYGIGEKDNRVLLATKGKHLADFTPEELSRMRQYNADDTDQCAALFYKLLPHYNAMELWHIHQKICGMVESPLILDVPLLEDALRREREAKQQTLVELAALLGVENPDEVKTVLASAPKFKELLETRGVAVPLKASPTDPEKLIPALAKSDAEFVALQEHPDPVVAAATGARLSVKSTITETRLQTFVEAARHTGGHWPVTANYCGAVTTGRGSGWYYNPYNLPKILKRARPSDALRGSIRVPPGFAVVVADLSGIELRFNHTLWNVPYSTRLWREDPTADIYRAYYGLKLGLRPEEITSEQRFAAKVECLGLGFGMGHVKYQFTARNEAAKWGKVMELTLAEAKRDVDGWRALHPEITKGWRTCHEALQFIAAGKEIAIDPRGMFVTCAEGIRLPSGRLIRYPNLRQVKRLEKPRKADGTTDHEGTPRVTVDWVYGEGRHTDRIYAGKVDENIVQAGSRDVMYEALFDIYKLTGYAHVHEVYDEGVWVVPEAEAPDFLNEVHKRLRRAPLWFPDLVTWSEGAFGGCYAEAK